MGEERIKQAKNNFKDYLDEGKMKRMNRFNNVIYETYLRNAKERLNVANQLKAKGASFQYWTTEKIKESKAKTSLNGVKEFVELIRGGLGK